MKKILFIIIPLVLILIIACFIPVTRKQEVIITSNLYNAALEIQRPESWLQWYPEIKKAYESNPSASTIKKDSSEHVFSINTPDHEFYIKRINPLTYEIKEKINTNSFTYGLTITPFKENAIRVSIINKISLINFLSPFLKHDSESITVNSLKSYLEDPKTLYGFSISLTTLVDTVVATKRYKTAGKNMFSNLSPSFADVEQYIKNNKLTIVNKKEVSYSSINNDSLLIMVGIPVNKSAPPERDITCMKMPEKGKLVSGYYEGKFGNRKEIYKAMERFIADHNLHKIASPFEKYIDNTLPAADSSPVKFELFYPVL